MNIQIENKESNLKCINRLILAKLKLNPDKVLFKMKKMTVGTNADKTQKLIASTNNQHKSNLSSYLWSLSIHCIILSVF